jgi:hypothetical protein
LSEHLGPTSTSSSTINAATCIVIVCAVFFLHAASPFQPHGSAKGAAASWLAPLIRHCVVILLLDVAAGKRLIRGRVLPRTTGFKESPNLTGRSIMQGRNGLARITALCGTMP